MEDLPKQMQSTRSLEVANHTSSIWGLESDQGATGLYPKRFKLATLLSEVTLRAIALS